MSLSGLLATTTLVALSEGRGTVRLMAPPLKFDLATLEATIDQWTGTIPDGGSFSAATYDRWYRSQVEPKPPSQATIAKYLADGGSWAQALLARRAAIAATAPDRSVEVPVICRARAIPRWVPRTLSAWSEDPSCGCVKCQQPTIAQTHPDLVAFLCEPADAQRVVSSWVDWSCPVGGPRHQPLRGTAAWVAQGRPYCRQCRGRPFRNAHAAPRGGTELGSMTVSRNPVSSALEQEVRKIISDAGYTVPEQKMAIWCRHATITGEVVAITPDVILVDHHIAVEVDPCQPLTSDHGYSHHGKEDEDRLRNQLLAEAGWVVLRVRLGAQEGAQIGDRDVVCASTGVTKNCADALLAAVDDLVHGREPSVRFVPGSATPRKPATRRSSVVRLGTYDYADQAHIFSWYPDPESSNKVHLRLAMGGRYLYTHTKPPLFIAEAGLQDVPADQWRARLQELLVDLPPLGGEQFKYPWGNELLVAEHTGAETTQVVQDCEQRTSIDRAHFYFTTNCPAIDAWTPTALLSVDLTVLVRLHDDAVHLGYRFEGVEKRVGRYGPYETITVTRLPE